MVYLDNAATSRFIPRCVLNTLYQHCAKKVNAGRGGYKESVNEALEIFRTREVVLQYYGNSEGKVVFTKSCTEALNLAILGVAKKGHVITTVTEHNSVLRPLKELEKRGIIRLTIVEPDGRYGVNAEDIKRHLKGDTNLLCINHCSNVTGVRNDIEDICRLASRYGIRTLVDDAQGAGHIRLDMKGCGIDMLASAGHKGLHGVQGTGFLTYNGVDIEPIIYGGTGTDSISIYQPKGSPEGLESGTLNGAGICALKSGIEWTKERLGNIALFNKKLSAFLIEELSIIKNVKVYSKASATGVVAFIIQGYTSEEIADYLNFCGYEVRGGLHCAPLMHKHLKTLDSGLVRISIGQNNSERDIEGVLRCISRFEKNRRKY